MKKSCGQFKGSGFTLVELLVALMVTAIILTAVTSLTYALGSAHKYTKQLSRKQSFLRYTTLQVVEQVRYSNLAVSSALGGVALWKDDNADGIITGSEVSYIEPDATDTKLQLLVYPFSADVLTTADMQTGTDRALSATMISGCSNIVFTLIAPKQVNVAFDLTENEVTQSYNISAVLRSSDEHLI